MNRESILNYVEKTYKSTPEYLWKSYPEHAVLRHRDNRKWYAIIMSVPKDKLGLNGTENIDIINVKCEPEMIGSLRMTEGILPGYHMNKGHWISILLDGSVDDAMICQLLDMSFQLTETKKKKGKGVSI